ncbi:MAG: hypothetical protein A3F69_05695 [Acidobacteria bacterium RIFCSPLOWO2_12_FULL_66_10]|nr:MAG: hypothetical protein A3F69_05695 [Acidobacteria bacterium RIFCSPLOWO2_12_FULL_66_10]
MTSTDKRNPALYPYGPVYGLDSAEDSIWALDPVKHTVTRYDVEPRASRSEGYNPKLNYYHDGGLGAGGIPQWGTHPHNPMLDDKGRIWVTAQVRGERPQDYPDWMRKTIVTETNAPAEIDAAEKLLRGSSHHRQLAYFDTKQKRFVPVDTVFGTHHLQFDRQGRIWTNTSSAADGVAVGMFDPSKFDADNPENTEPEAQKAYVRVDPRTGAHIPGWGYAVIPNPVDGTIWQANSQTDGPNNKLFVLDPKTGKFKDYPLPLPGRGPHGIDATTDGKLWFPTASGHLGRFDPKTELFTYWDLPGPKFKNVGSDTGSAQWAYFLWVDQFDALGLGKDTVIVCGTSFSALQAFNPRTESFTVITIPYPLTFYMRGLDGRIDDPKAGWKGRGLWTAYNGYLPRLFTESRIGTLVHVQLRPNPLAY